MRALTLALLVLALAGCGGKSATICKINSINVFPTAATVDHAAVPPGNTQQFAAFIAAGTNGCAFPLSNLTTASWSVSDPVNVNIGATIQDPNFGKATCKAATAGAVTVTAVVPAGDGTNVTHTASLTCN